FVQAFSQLNGVKYADSPPYDLARLIDNDGRGQNFADAHALHIVRCRAEPDGKIDLVFTNEFEDLLSIGGSIAGGADNLQAECSIVALDRSEVGHLFLTWFAPRRPIVKNYHTSAEAFERLAGTGQIGE